MTRDEIYAAQFCAANRIDSACFIDGNEDEFVVEFFYLGGSICRRVYNKRSTVTKHSFIPVNSWEYDKLLNYYQEYLGAGI